MPHIGDCQTLKRLSNIEPTENRRIGPMGLRNCAGRAAALCRTGRHIVEVLEVLPQASITAERRGSDYRCPRAAGQAKHVGTSTRCVPRNSNSGGNYRSPHDSLNFSAGVKHDASDPVFFVPHRPESGAREGSLSARWHRPLPRYPQVVPSSLPEQCDGNAEAIVLARHEVL
jgi:hypothetical protein